MVVDGHLLQHSCRFCSSSVYFVFEASQNTWHSNKENPSVYWNATLSYPLIASNYANLCLVQISFRSRSGCWPCFRLSRNPRGRISRKLKRIGRECKEMAVVSYLVLRACVSWFVAFRTRVAHFCFCLVRSYQCARNLSLHVHTARCIHQADRWRRLARLSGQWQVLYFFGHSQVAPSIRNARITILIPLAYFDVMHMISLGIIIRPEFWNSDVMIAYVVGGEARDANPTNYEK